MQGVFIVVAGLALMYLVLSGKMDCLISAFRACSGFSGAPAETAPTKTTLQTPALEPKATLNKVLSREI